MRMDMFGVGNLFRDLEGSVTATAALKSSKNMSLSSALAQSADEMGESLFLNFAYCTHAMGRGTRL